MASLSLEGRVAIITGASSGIGAGTAVLFAKRGCSVALAGTNEERLKETIQRCLDAGLKREQVLGVIGSIKTEKVREELISNTLKKFGKINILVNNAGIFAARFIKDLDENAVEENFNINFKVPVLLSKLALPHLLKTKGNIVNISSIASEELPPETAMYSISKSAVDTFTKAAANEWGPAGIRVNSVSPGAIDTPIFSKILGGDKAKMDMVAQMQSKLHALQRNGEVTEVAETVAFLASDASSFVSGTVVFADGGRHSYPAGSGSFSGKSAF